MKINKHLINFARKYPFVAHYGYSVLKNYWHLKADFVNYHFDKSKATVSKDLIVDFNKNRPYGPKKKICYAPFNNMHFQIDGNVSACSFNYDFLIGNVNKNTIKEIWNSENANAFREKLGNYNFDLCKSCEKVLQAKNYNSFPPLKYDMHADDNAAYPTQMSFEMSDLCNFECVMCNENFSSLIRKRKGLPPQKFNYPERFFDELLEFIPHLKIATFIGGEPLLIKSYFRIWEAILKHNNTCSIHIQTNASYLPPRFLEMLETGQFDIGISLDATEKTSFEQIRINADFEQIQENINVLKSFMDKGKVNLNINFCPLVLNWKEIPKIVEYSNRLNIPLKIVNVENPRNLSLQHRQATFLQHIIQALESTTFSNPQNIIQEKNIQSFQQYVQHLKFLQHEATQREAFFTTIEKEIAVKFETLFDTSSLFNNFSAEQRKQLHQRSTELITQLNQDEAIQRQTMFRVYYALYKFKHTNDGAASNNFEYGSSVLLNVIREFYALIMDEQHSVAVPN
ncbi:MAG: SPASM domain-containing protein [Chitinophagales bacterium]